MTTCELRLGGASSISSVVADGAKRCRLALVAARSRRHGSTAAPSAGARASRPRHADPTQPQGRPAPGETTGSLCTLYAAARSARSCGTCLTALARRIPMGPGRRRHGGSPPASASSPLLHLAADDAVISSSPQSCPNPHTHFRLVDAQRWSLAAARRETASALPGRNVPRCNHWRTTAKSGGQILFDEELVSVRFTGWRSLSALVPDGPPFAESPVSLHPVEAGRTACLEHAPRSF